MCGVLDCAVCRACRRAWAARAALAEGEGAVCAPQHGNTLGGGGGGVPVPCPGSPPPYPPPPPTPLQMSPPHRAFLLLLLVVVVKVNGSLQWEPVTKHGCTCAHSCQPCTDYDASETEGGCYFGTYFCYTNPCDTAQSSAESLWYDWDNCVLKVVVTPTPASTATRTAPASRSHSASNSRVSATRSRSQGPASSSPRVTSTPARTVTVTPVRTRTAVSTKTATASNSPWSVTEAHWTLGDAGVSCDIACGDAGGCVATAFDASPDTAGLKKIVASVGCSNVVPCANGMFFTDDLTETSGADPAYYNEGCYNPKQGAYPSCGTKPADPSVRRFCPCADPAPFASCTPAPSATPSSRPPGACETGVDYSGADLGGADAPYAIYQPTKTACYNYCQQNLDCYAFTWHTLAASNQPGFCFPKKRGWNPVSISTAVSCVANVRCPPGYALHGGSCYSFEKHSANFTWSVASSLCSQNGYLATFKSHKEEYFVIEGCGATGNDTQLSYWVGVHDVSTSKTRKYRWAHNSEDVVTTTQYNSFIKPNWGTGAKSGTTDSNNKCMLVTKDSKQSDPYLTVTRCDKLKGPSICCEAPLL